MLAELFGGRAALLDPPRAATIKSLIAFQAFWDRHPSLYDQICQVGRWHRWELYLPANPHSPDRTATSI